MKFLLHPAVTAAALSFVCCLVWLGPLVSPYHIWIYHDSGAAAAVFLPTLFNLVLLWLLLLLLLLVARGPGRLRVVVWSGVIILLPWILLKDVVVLCAWKLPHWVSVGVFLASGLCWVAVVALWRPSFAGGFERVQQFSSHILAFMALLAFFATGQLIWCFWDARSLQTPRTLHSSGSQATIGARGQRPRIIWLILDELSYQQVYERRFPALELPAFDQLASQATVFTRVEPAANYTEAAVPSMMTGLRVDRIRADGDGMLNALHNPVTGQWQPFHARETVFQDALNHGYRTGVAGWYNPYCRILPEVLDHCRWSVREFDGGMGAGSSIVANVTGQWARLFYLTLEHGSVVDRGEERDGAAHLADYRDMVVAGDQLLQDSSIDFMLLHIPVPHPGGIYDRRTQKFTTHHASYIDNLALADRYLGHVHDMLVERGEWDSSAIVVMGDHSWRTKLLWEGLRSWTAEDQAASHGGEFDDRPGYIVKLPHQEAGARIDGGFSAVRTRALLAGIAGGSIRTVPELAAFAGQREPAELSATRVGGVGLQDRGR